MVQVEEFSKRFPTVGDFCRFLKHESTNSQLLGLHYKNDQSTSPLIELTEAMVSENVFVPTGECIDIGVSGHVQTGGIGVWSRAFGPMVNWCICLLSSVAS